MKKIDLQFLLPRNRTKEQLELSIACSVVYMWTCGFMAAVALCFDAPFFVTAFLLMLVYWANLYHFDTRTAIHKGWYRK